MSNKELPTLSDLSRVPEELLPVLRWWQDRGPKTLAYVAGGLAIVAGIALWFNQREASRATAVAALATAAEVEDYEAIVALGTPASEVARLDLAKSLFQAGDYEQALATYNRALETLQEPTLKDIAAVGRICALEALGQFDEALADIQSLETAFAEATIPHYLVAELTFAKARVLCQAGDKAAAKQALAAILTAEKDTPLAQYTAQAERLVSTINAYVKPSLFDKAAEVAPVAPEAPPAAPEATPEAK